MRARMKNTFYKHQRMLSGEGFKLNFVLISIEVEQIYLEEFRFRYTLYKGNHSGLYKKSANR